MEKGILVVSQGLLRKQKILFYCCLGNKVISVKTRLEQDIFYSILIKPFIDHFKMPHAMIMLKLIYTESPPTFYCNSNEG